MSQLIESPTPSVAEETSPVSQSDSSEAVGVGEPQQAVEPSGQVVEQGTGADAAQVAQPDPAQAQEVDEDEAPAETAAPKSLRDYAERMQTRARTAEQAIQPFGGVEGLQRLGEAYFALRNPETDPVAALEQVFQLAPHLDRDDLYETVIDVLPDERAEQYLRSRGDDVAKMLFGNILGTDPEFQKEPFNYVLRTLELYKPDEEQLPEHVRTELAEAKREREQFKTERERAATEQTRAREAEFTRQYQAASLDLGKRKWETPTAYVDQRLKFTELPADAPQEAKDDFAFAQWSARSATVRDVQTDQRLQQLDRLSNAQLGHALKLAARAQGEPNPQRRDMLMQQARGLKAEAETHAASFAEGVRRVYQQNAIRSKRLFDATMQLRASEANNASNQRAEVAGAGGSGVVSSAANGPMPAYGTPAWEKWVTTGFTPQPAPRQI